ncbi:MAG: hypothetical protein JWM47_1812 [Acidimicrobiales bacterium]|nr:hypothetical protein [Acidimicrobiales bacterium]
MAPQHPVPDAGLRRRPLLIGPGGDLTLVDGTGLGAADVARRVREAVTSTNTAAACGGSLDTSLAASRAGALLVGAGRDVAAALDRARALVDHGVPVASLVAEVPFGTGAAAESAVGAILAAGFAAGIVIDADADAVADAVAVADGDATASAPGAGSDDDASAAAVAGWQIGALTATLALPVRTVRGVSAERFRRVVGVMDAIEGAGARAAASGAPGDRASNGGDPT